MHNGKRLARLRPGGRLGCAFVQCFDQQNVSRDPDHIGHGHAGFGHRGEHPRLAIHQRAGLGDDASAAL